MLTKLGSHYWRPDFGEAQVRQLIRDYVEDLDEFSTEEIDGALCAYRRDPSNQFFPRSAQIREVIYQERKDDMERERYPLRAQQESRPIFWWLTFRWKPHWLESEIPEEERAAWERIKAKREKEIARP